MEKERLLLENRAMKMLFPNFQLRKDGEEMFWHGKISSNSGIFEVVLKYPKGFPSVPPHVFITNKPPLDLPIDKAGQLIFKKEWKENFTSATVIKWTKELLQTIKYSPSREGHDYAGRTLYVPVICNTTKQTYLLIFLKKIDNKVNLVDIEKTNKINKDDKTYSEIMENINWREYDKLGGCPYCHEKGIVLCGNCKNLSCMGGIKTLLLIKYFKCPWCHRKGIIRGTFNKLDGFNSPKKMKF